MRVEKLNSICSPAVPKFFLWRCLLFSVLHSATLSSGVSENIVHVSVHWHYLFCELLHVMVLMNLLSLGMIVCNQVTPYIIVESRSFLFHPWQICHATNLTNISFWLPNFTSFFHQSNALRKWKQIICKYNIPFPYFYLQPWKTSCFTGCPFPISHPLVPIKTFLLSFYDPSIQVQNSHSSPFQFNSFTSESCTCRGTL